MSFFKSLIAYIAKFKQNKCDVCSQSKKICAPICDCDVKYCISCFQKLNYECQTCHKKKKMSNTFNEDIYVDSHLYNLELSTYCPNGNIGLGANDSYYILVN